MATSEHLITPREKLDFMLDGGVPRFWLGGDPFKTRFFDAMSLTFPSGERFFISAVRAYRDRTIDPSLQSAVRDFIRQEGQHGIIHTKWNSLLKDQGLECVSRFERFLNWKFELQLKHLPKAYNLAYTSAAEHVTAMMGSSFVDRQDMSGMFDTKMRALWVWHSIEEVEHKAVAFDVMKNVANIGYPLRVLALVAFTFEFTVGIWFGINQMLKEDGFGLLARIRMLIKGAWWLYGAKGILSSSLRTYLSYLKPGFHPWQNPGMKEYATWTRAFNDSGSPIDAADAYHTKLMSTV